MELVEDLVLLPDGELDLLRPRSSEALLDEDAFERDEFIPYWAELWPSGVHLARVVVRRPLRGRTVLELGCGLGVPSLAAALSGARVLATDWAPEALALLRRNALGVGVVVETAIVDWSRPEQLLERAPFDLVLAADVLYERRNVGQLLEVLPRLTGEVLLADPGREFARGFLERAGAEWSVSSQRDGMVTIHRLRR